MTAGKFFLLQQYNLNACNDSTTPLEKITHRNMNMYVHNNLNIANCNPAVASYYNVNQNNYCKKSKSAVVLATSSTYAASPSASPSSTEVEKATAVTDDASAAATKSKSSSQSQSIFRMPTVFHNIDDEMSVDDWEERDENTTLGVHIVAGSTAGLVEHIAIFPLDTIRTHAQSSKLNGSTSAYANAADLISKRGPLFLWRGSMALAWAVVPAHAALFSTYESIMNFGLPDRHFHIPTTTEDSDGNKNFVCEHGHNSEKECKSYSGQRVAMVGFLAGTLSGLVHDLIMVPAETIKQRLQLGYYKNARHAISRMAAAGGHSFYRSLPITLVMSIPYSSIMMSSNETLRYYLNPSGHYSLSTFLLAGALSGSFAAAATTPLDVIRTKLNTQGLERAKASKGELNAAPKEFKVRYNGFADAFRSIAKNHGVRGFFRGVGPRVLQMGPSCALSWCAYETAKKFCSNVTSSSSSINHRQKTIGGGGHNNIAATSARHD